MTAFRIKDQVVIGLRLVALVLVSTALVVGCIGGEDDAVTPTTTPLPATSTAEEVATTTDELDFTVTIDDPQIDLTHAEFIAWLDAVCQRVNRTTQPHLDRFVTAFAQGNYTTAADELEAAVEIEASVYVRLAAIEPPEEDARQFERYLDLSHQIEALAMRTARAYREEDLEEASRLADQVDRVANRRTLVTASPGLRECGTLSGDGG